MNARHRDPQASDLERENERLRRELADREQQIRQQADQIADQQKQIADAESRSRIWSVNWRCASRTLRTLLSRRPPTDWPVSRVSAAGARRAGERWADNPAIAGCIGPWCLSPKSTRFGPSCRNSASTAGMLDPRT